MSTYCISYACSFGVFERAHALLTRLIRKTMRFWNAQVVPTKKHARVNTAETNDILATYLVDTYGNAVLRLAYSYVHNMSDAEEILQDTLMKFLQACPDVESKDHERAWLLRVAANLSKNKIRYNALRDTDELSDELAASKREDLSFVWDAVKALPDNYREVAHLYYYEGYPTKQIANILDRNESTVRSDLRRAREQLKNILEVEYDLGR